MVGEKKDVVTFFLRSCILFLIHMYSLSLFFLEKSIQSITTVLHAFILVCCPACSRWQCKDRLQDTKESRATQSTMEVKHILLHKYKTGKGSEGGGGT